MKHTLAAMFLLSLPGAVGAADATKPVKVFILAGQSNMEGKARLPLLEYQAQQPGTRALFQHLRKDGKWVERDDVWIKFLDRKGKLTVGYGSPDCIGPELEFGTVVGDRYDEQVLLIKTAWGGRSLYRDFRPPSAGLPPAEVLDKLLAQLQKKKPEATLDDVKQTFGTSYRAMRDEVNATLADLKVHFPDYAGQGYELAGFVWFQGWNDMISAGATAEYASNLKHFIRDVRKEFKAPRLPFAIGQMGVDGANPGDGVKKFKAAQAAVMGEPEFDGNVALVKTDEFWDTDAEAVFKKGWREHLDEWNKVGSDYPYHYLGSAKTMLHIGRAFGEAILDLRGEQQHEVREVEGWKVRVDTRLLAGHGAELGSRALRVLAFKLYEIKTLLPADRVAKLQKVTIVLDHSHRLRSMQYHPSVEWLKAHGHDPELVKSVHIPRAIALTTRFPVNQQPMAVLHELAHAYHDQVLSFDEPRIKAAWARFKDSGKYEKVLHISGKEGRHYGLTNPMEFFAEMTESFFGTNDFYPFVRGELKKELPDVYDLLDEVWVKPLPEKTGAASRPTLQQQLAGEDVQTLAAAARTTGDASRGAVIFHRPDLACTRCHTAGEDGARLGPDLAKAGPDATDVYLIESVLLPSKVIKKGYETVVLTTRAGKVLTGLVAEERADALVLRDAEQDGKLITVPKQEIEERTVKSVSVMPEGLVNLLSSRQEFLDLARYLMEIAAKGPERARQLRPAASLFAPPPLPEYERDLDHAGLLRALDAQSFKRGETIYARVCVNCHGTKEQPGSLPVSLRFSDGKFKNGADPFRMYQTLTHGFGMMTPQTWMVPVQKYDVIHYIREAYLKPYNPGQYVKVDDAYLVTLPKGSNRGPKPSNIEPWVSMNYGPSLLATLEVGDKGNFAYKGIAVRLDSGPGGVSRGRHWMLFDHDTLRAAAAWSGEGFIDWHGINFDGRHQVHPRVVGAVRFANSMGPGWADPETGSFDDPRPRGRDGKPYGPLPREWARYRGMYHYGNQVILSYTVGSAPVLEMPAYELASGGKVVFTRTLDVGKSSRDLLMRVAPAGTAVALVANGAVLEEKDGSTLLRIPASATPLTLKLLLADGHSEALRDFAKTSPPAASLQPFTKGGPRRWPEMLKTTAVVGGDAQAFAIDVLTHPAGNPWNCQMRLTGFDFFADGRRAAVCTWDGDVWLVDGIDTPANGLTWQRIASGLFQPLGLKIVREKIHVSCRDQIVILHDLNGDGETDFYECFNSDHQVTEHFHEFAMGLQTDAEGNFYYAKAARHALKAIVPQHGTLLRVSKDGTRTDILATGFRAPNGVCVNPDGTFFLTDQEGFWVPKNRIDLVERGGYYGNFWGYHDVTDPSDKAMKQPLCWITNAFDRSPSEMLWVTGDGWGPLKGSLLNFSYGYGKVYVVPYEKVEGQVQGGMCALPIPPFPTGVMRGRFHPGNGQLYCCGMFAWAGNQTQPGGFYRVRYTGKPVSLPVGLHAGKGGMTIRFSGPLDPKAAENAANYVVQTWSLKRSEQYGSNHYDQKPVKVAAVRLSADRTAVMLQLDDLKPTWGMEIKYSLRGATGETVEGVVHNTVHHLGD